MTAQDQFERYYTEKIWALIPEVYRSEDGLAERPDVLRQLVKVIAGQAAITRRSIDRLWEDQHIETCDDWAVPYIGDLVGTRMLSELDPRARRVDVARTVHFRRRRGTPSLLESLVQEISGWDVVLAEAYRRLARTAHRLDSFPVALGRATRTPAAGTANLRSARNAELYPGAFDELYSTADVRRQHGLRGLLNVPKLNFHVFRTRAFPAVEVTPYRLQDSGPVTFTVDPSGRDIQLFSRGLPVSGGLRLCGTPWAELPGPGADPTDSDLCDRRGLATDELEVARRCPCSLLSDAAYELNADAVLHAIAGGADATVLKTLQGWRFESEARLRGQLTTLGVSFTPQPAWYHPLLRESVTSTSAKPKLLPTFGQESVNISLDAGDPPPNFDQTTGANLSSRTCHPTPSDTGIQLLVDPERGRFARTGPTPPSGSALHPTVVRPQDFVLFVRTTAQTLSSGTQVHDAAGTGWGKVGSSGTGATQLKVNGATGSIYSRPVVNLEAGAHVHGDVETNSNITQGAGAIIDGQARPQLLPDFSAVTAALNFTVTYPAEGPNVSVSGGATVTLAPGSYRALTVLANGTLQLSSGNYFFKSILCNNPCQIKVNAGAGKVYIFVKEGVTHRGLNVMTAGTFSDLVFVLTGGSYVSDAAGPGASGIVVGGPTSFLFLQSASYTGSFFGHSTSTVPNQTYTHAPWDGVLPSPPVTYGTVPDLPAATTGLVTVTGDTYDVNIVMPSATPVASVVLLTGTGPLDLRDATVTGPTGFGAMVDLSGRPTQIGPNSVSGSVWSAGNTTIKAGSAINGSMTTAGAVSIHTTANITGTLKQLASLAVHSVITFQVVFPPVPGGTPQTASGPIPLALPPGNYGNVTVQTGAALLLSPGIYRFDQLLVQAGGELQLDASASLQLNIRSTLQLLGTQRFIAGGQANFRFAYFGTAAIALTTPFSAQFYAPRAALTLGPLASGQFEGAFFADSMVVLDGVTVSAGFSDEPEVNRYFYGFAGEVGAGGYTRVPPVEPELPGADGGGVIGPLPSTGPLTINDSRTYELSITSANTIQNATLQATDGARPYVKVLGAAPSAATLKPASGAPRSFRIDGVWLGSAVDERTDWVIDSATPSPSGFDWDEIVITHSTFDPGGERADQTTIAPLVLVVRGRVRRLVIERSIIAAVIVDFAASTPGQIETLEIRDSIIDAMQTALVSERHVAIQNPTGNVQMTGCTVFGDIHAGLLTASDCLVSGRLVVANTQDSCFRFSAASFDDVEPDTPVRLPKLYRVPPIGLIRKHFFVSTRFGDPGYAQLSSAAPTEVARGAENTSEMGAFSFLMWPVRLESIRTKVDEFKPVGVLPQFILEESAARLVEPAE